uniref:HDC15896 n=1 Tax=Drosophila melanogaster TaxID=7227 RepID=Q6IJ49_DROME|nr:TPA_inf: HDC15896 [Drosophila melanogaster]
MQLQWLLPKLPLHLGFVLVGAYSFAFPLLTRQWPKGKGSVGGFTVALFHGLSKIDATSLGVEGFLGRCSCTLLSGRRDPEICAPQGAASDRLGTRTATNVCQVATQCLKTIQQANIIMIYFSHKSSLNINRHSANL